MDADLENMSREQLITEVRKLRAGIRHQFARLTPACCSDVACRRGVAFLGDGSAASASGDQVACEEGSRCAKWALPLWPEPSHS